jgi:transcriptional regulator with XRE-family HTH domain
LSIGRRVRDLRLELGFTFDAFVEETGLGRGYISELERGLVVPTVSALAKIARALELTMADLVVGGSIRERLFDATRKAEEPLLRRLLRDVEDARAELPALAATYTRIPDPRPTLQVGDSSQPRKSPRTPKPRTRD